MQEVLGERAAASHQGGPKAAFSAPLPQVRGAGGERAAHAARSAAAATLGAMALLATYMVVHAFFILHRVPQSILRLSAVPLFATCLASTGAGALTASLGFASIEDGAALMRRLKLPLAVVTLLFTLEILFAP